MNARRSILRLFARYMIAVAGEGGRQDRREHARLCPSGLELGNCYLCKSDCERELLDTYVTVMRYPWLAPVARLARIAYRKNAYEKEKHDATPRS